MLSLSQYIEPLGGWIKQHHEWAIFLTFILALAESLAIVGSIVPGSVTMTAVGILAGAGMLRIDLTFLASILGAVAGDGLSYVLGYYFRENLSQLWPFSRYPKMLAYGRAYFKKHGGRSVLLGRFIGPLRSIIPLIAGMMHMRPAPFFSANLISGIGWSILYLLPGILIGAASNQLPPEAAGRLFFLILALLIGLWLSSLLVQWLLARIHFFLKAHLHDFWEYSLRHPKLTYYFRLLTPAKEEDHYPTVLLLLSLLLCFIVALVLIILHFQASAALSSFDNGCNFFLQGLRSEYFDQFLLPFALSTQTIPLACFIFALLFALIYQGNWLMLRYWLSLAMASFFVWILFSRMMYYHLPSMLNRHGYTATVNLTMLSSFSAFLIASLSETKDLVASLLLRYCLVLLLLFAGLASLYFSSLHASECILAYCLAGLLFLTHWLGFRRFSSRKSLSVPASSMAVLALLFGVLGGYLINGKDFLRSHQLKIKPVFLTEHKWWEQKEALLPLYTSNRIGQHSGIFNIQYQGTVGNLARALSLKGWEEQPLSILQSLLVRTTSSKNRLRLPLLPPLYLNHKPNLIMVLRQERPKQDLILCFWRSNYYLESFDKPIWIGSLNRLPLHRNKPMAAAELLSPALWAFSQKRISLKHQHWSLWGQAIEPELLLIQEK